MTIQITHKEALASLPNGAVIKLAGYNGRGKAFTTTLTKKGPRRLEEGGRWFTKAGNLIKIEWNKDPATEFAKGSVRAFGSQTVFGVERVSVELVYVGHITLHKAMSWETKRSRQKLSAIGSYERTGYLDKSGRYFLAAEISNGKFGTSVPKVTGWELFDTHSEGNNHAILISAHTNLKKAKKSVEEVVIANAVSLNGG